MSLGNKRSTRKTPNKTPKYLKAHVSRAKHLAVYQKKKIRKKSEPTVYDWCGIYVVV